MSARTDIAALRLLIAVAGTGSLSAAARSSGTSQQAVSARIRSLEAQLGVTLVRRSSQGSRLSDAGSVVAGWAQDVVDAADRFDAAVAALGTTSEAPLRVSASLTIAEHLMPRWLVDLRERTPVEVELTAANSSGVLERIRSGAADLGFVESPDVPAEVQSRTVGEDELVVVVRPGHPWSRRRRGITAATLAGTPLIVREAGSGTRSALTAALAARDETAVPAAAVLPTTAAIRATVAASDSPAVLSALAVADAVRAGSLVRIPLSDLTITRPLTAIWTKGTRPSAAARQLLATIAMSS